MLRLATPKIQNGEKIEQTTLDLAHESYVYRSGSGFLEKFSQKSRDAEYDAFLINSAAQIIREANPWAIGRNEETGEIRVTGRQETIVVRGQECSPQNPDNSFFSVSLMIYDSRMQPKAELVFSEKPPHFSDQWTRIDSLYKEADIKRRLLW